MIAILEIPCLLDPPLLNINDMRMEASSVAPKSDITEFLHWGLDEAIFMRGEIMPVNGLGCILLSVFIFCVFLILCKLPRIAADKLGGDINWLNNNSNKTK